MPAPDPAPAPEAAGMLVLRVDDDGRLTVVGGRNKPVAAGKAGSRALAGTLSFPTGGELPVTLKLAEG